MPLAVVLLSDMLLEMCGCCPAGVGQFCLHNTLDRGNLTDMTPTTSPCLFTSPILLEDAPAHVCVCVNVLVVSCCSGTVLPTR
jgi:hypothetical protein